MNGLTVIVPARNEEQSVRDVSRGIRQALDSLGAPYRLILVNDGSTDATRDVLEDLRAEDPTRTEVIHHASPRGLGGAYKAALARVQTEFVTWIPADGEIRPTSLLEAASDLRDDTVVVPYPVSPLKTRGFGRWALSVAFQRGLNVLFLNQIRYFNGNAIYPTALIRAVEVRSNGHSFNSELLLRVLARFSPRIRQVPFELAPREHGVSKALRPSGVLDVAGSLARLRLALWRQV